MLRINDDIYCGLFDSAILRKGQAKSMERKVGCYEIELFHTESGVSHVDGRIYPIRRGMLLCAKPGQIRYSEFPVRCNFIHVFVSETDADVLSAIEALPTCTYLEDDDSLGELVAAFNKLGTYFVSSSTDTADSVRVNALFFDILYRCLRACESTAVRSSSQSANWIVKETYEYIREHYSTDCSLKTLAEAVSVSPNHLQAVFTKCVGITPSRYVTLKRVEKAKKLLMSGEKTLLEIALETGFCSQSHFTKVFKEQTGKTPSLYQKELLEKY